MTIKTTYSMLMIAFAIVVGGCSSKVDTSSQATAMTSYLKDKTYDTISGGYRYVINNDRVGYTDDAILKKGDSVKYYFAMYKFSNGLGALFYTNIESLMATDTIIDTRYWDFTQRHIKLGSSADLAAVQNGIIGSRTGDSILLLTPSDNVFGDKQNGIIPANTPLAWILKVEKIN